MCSFAIATAIIFDIGVDNEIFGRTIARGR